uniref:S1 motif domain-containing protein n=1 Tax=Octactis speculum TaxID=3111310 RepID=A0A7S2GDT7_9STRA|mmetsp:Transcript_42922/g.58603  ORF Transcript_42922/g.58603 Transcript_42922/m.58603 type:complete len:208 (+) Transcript_42922:33-656(+)|eukprot:CAMPEP_0185754612 /NCGR_PEP_ID=MMETSP1174-20130828/13237_1 /TAXON_ID=35687 /ORGANISM="Dictyocha speculum, Strain CCMP1381" /LENGTH=207 /DNA_ID=CAMNT_0028432895 /DNA_START=33 /DNA_END=656 /DNA_ORIENTATION=+
MLMPASLTRREGTTVVPGEHIIESQMVVTGNGTYERDGQIFAALAGKVKVEEPETGGNKPMVTVGHWLQKDNTKQVPRVGQVIMGRVTRITANTAQVDITCLGDNILRQPCSGMIRTEDVYPKDVDIQVEMSQCFRPGDVVRAQIMSLGDLRHYYLSTAQLKLGVCWAPSPSDAQTIMIPISWNQLRCPVSGVTANRKCAQPKSDAQ